MSTPGRSWLYRGVLTHTRRDAHVQRTFRYPVYVAAIDLDAPPVLRLLSRNARNLFSLHDRDYATPLAGGTLITNLRVAGYTFNPVSFFLRYTADRLASVIAEVNNTYGGRHCYVLDDTNRIALPPRAPPGDEASRGATMPGAPSRGVTMPGAPSRGATMPGAPSHGATLPGAPARVGFRVARELFVSPFLHGPRTYDFWFPAQRDPERLAIAMHVATPTGERVLTATLSGTRTPLTDGALARAAVRYPLMTAQVIGLIHLEALKLRYLHGVPYRRPGQDHRPLDA